MNQIKVQGLNGLIRGLKRAEAEDLLDKLKESNAEAARIVKDTAYPNVPVRSGNLAASLRSSATARAGVVRIGKAKVPYAGPIHFGWHRKHIAPNPFLYEAMDARIDEVTTAYWERVEKLLEGITSSGD